MWMIASLATPHIWKKKTPAAPAFIALGQFQAKLEIHEL
jgi:hypothetical protein